MARKLTRGAQKSTAHKRSSRPRRSQIITDMAPADREVRASVLDSRLSLVGRIQAEREQLFKAISIVESCKYASATMLEVNSPEYIVGVFDVLCDLLNASAGELGCIADDYRRLR